MIKTILLNLTHAHTHTNTHTHAHRHKTQREKERERERERERIEAKKNNVKDVKALYKSMNNAIFGKVKENLRNRINVKLVNNKKSYLKCTLKPRYMQHKIFDNNLAAIRKSKTSLKPNKPAYIRICVSQLSQVFMYKFHSGYIEKKKWQQCKTIIFRY